MCEWSVALLTLSSLSMTAIAIPFIVINFLAKQKWLKIFSFVIPLIILLQGIAFWTTTVPRLGVLDCNF